MSDTKGCEECDWRGWIHCGEPFEIERHDLCATFPSEEAAVKAHAVDCGCDWPPVDYQNLLTRWVDIYSGHRRQMPSDIQLALRELCRLASDRSGFLNNLDQLMSLVGRITHMSLTHPDTDRKIEVYTQAGRTERPWSESLLRELQGAGGLLLNVSYLVKSGQWKS